MLSTLAPMTSSQCPNPFLRIIPQLNVKDEDWKTREAALASLAKVSVANPTLAPETFSCLIVPLRSTLTDLRSIIVRESASSLSGMARLYGNRLKLLLRGLMPSLLETRGCSNKVNATYMNQCILDCIQYTTVKYVLMEILDVLSTTKNKELQRACLTYVALVLKVWSSQLIVPYKAKMERCILIGLNGASAKSRETARECYWAYVAQFPADALDLQVLVGPKMYLQLQKTRPETKTVAKRPALATLSSNEVAKRTEEDDDAVLKKPVTIEEIPDENVAVVVAEVVDKAINNVATLVSDNQKNVISAAASEIVVPATSDCNNTREDEQVLMLALAEVDFLKEQVELKDEEIEELKSSTEMVVQEQHDDNDSSEVVTLKAGIAERDLQLRLLAEERHSIEAQQMQLMSENKSLVSRIDELECEKDTNALNQDLQGELDTASTENAELKEQQKALVQEKLELQGALSALQKENSIDEISEKLRELNIINDNTEQENLDLKKELKIVTENNDTLREEYEILNSEMGETLQQMRDENQSTEKQLKDVMVKYTDLQCAAESEKEEIQKGSQSTLEALKAIEDEKSVVESKLQILTEELDSLRNSKDRINQELEGTQVQLSSVNDIHASTVSQLQFELDEANTRLRSMEDERTSLAADRVEEVQALHSAKDLVCKELEDTKAELKTNSKIYEKTQCDLKTQLNEVKENLATMEDEKSNAEYELNLFRESQTVQVATRDAEVARLTTLLANETQAWEAEIKSLNGRVTEITDAAATNAHELRNEIERVTQAKVALATEVEARENEIKALQAKHESEVDKLSFDVDELTQQLTDKTSELTVLEESVKTKSEEWKQMKKKLNSTRHQTLEVCGKQHQTILKLTQQLEEATKNHDK